MKKTRKGQACGTHLIPNLRGASHPPFPIVTVRYSIRLPVEYHGVDKDILDLARVLMPPEIGSSTLTCISTSNAYSGKESSISTNHAQCKVALWIQNARSEKYC